VDILDILLVAVIFYWITFQWVVGNFLGGFIVILVVIFQSEIRRGLARMGQARILGWSPLSARPDFLEEIASSAFRLAEVGKARFSRGDRVLCLPACRIPHRGPPPAGTEYGSFGIH
jgi:DNA integrity scanning protein DisA with diadenylate cyclase activity